MSRAKIPLSAYDPRFAALLLRGGSEAFELECTTTKRAYVLRREIQSFRKRFKDEKGGPAAGPFYQCLLTIRGTKLRFSPRTAAFDDILGEATSATAPQLELPPDDLLDSLEAEALATPEGEKSA